MTFSIANENIGTNYPVFGGKSLREIVRKQDLTVGGEFVVPFPHQDLHKEPRQELHLIPGVAVVHLGSAHFFHGGAEGGQTGAEGKRRPDQAAARKGLDVHIPPGHFPEGQELAGKRNRLGLHNIAHQKNLGGDIV